MTTKSVTAIATLLICFGSAMLAAGQQPPHCAQSLFCLFNQEAATSDPSGIHKYSEDLIGMIVRNPAENQELTRLRNELADRLATAEEAARADNRKLVPEVSVAKAFNDFMQEIGAPSSLKTDAVTIHRFREHAAAIKVFPALFSADRNGTNCNPGEAVFLISLLISDNDALHEKNLDAQKALMQWDTRRDRDGPSFGVAHVESMGMDASGLLLKYLSQHRTNDAKALLNQMANTAGF